MRILKTAIFFIILMPGVAMPNITNHPNWAAINTYSAAFVGTIKTYQDQFYAVNGRYFQGVQLLGYDAKPDGTADVQTVNTAKPTDQAETWRDFAPNVFKQNLKIPIQLTLTPFTCHDGSGWILEGEVWYPGLGPDSRGLDGDHWVYRHYEGPLSCRGVYDWEEWTIEPEY
jgi:hypothetical protein